MKLLCVNIEVDLLPFQKLHQLECDLTIGKIYERSESPLLINTKYYYYLTGDNGIKLYYDKRFFVPLEEFRDEQIDKILK